MLMAAYLSLAPTLDHLCTLRSTRGSKGNPRETREGWPLLTVETEVNGDSKSTNGWFVGLVVLVQKTFILPGCPGQPITKYFFPHRALFQFMCPHRPETWAGSRAGPPVSECVSPGKPYTYYTEKRRERSRWVSFQQPLYAN